MLYLFLGHEIDRTGLVLHL